MDPQQTIQSIRAMLQQQGLPLTTDNLNRAMLALSRNEPMEAGGVDRSIDRTMAPRAAPRRAAQPTVRGGAAVQEQPVPPSEGGAGGPAMQEEAPLPVQQHRPGVVGADNMDRGAGLVRRGTVNGARMINEDDPAAGMWDGVAGGRQADDTGIDQTGLGVALLSPLAALAGMPAAGAAAARNLGVTLAPRGLLTGPGGAGSRMAGGNAGAIGAPVPRSGGNAAPNMSGNTERATSRVRAEAPRRGQQAKPNTERVVQPNIQGTKRAPTQPLRNQLIRKRLKEAAGRGR